MMSIGFSNLQQQQNPQCQIVVVCNLQIWTELFDGLVLVVHSGCNVKLFCTYKSRWAGRHLYHAT